MTGKCLEVSSVLVWWNPTLLFLFQRLAATDLFIPEVGGDQNKAKREENIGLPIDTDRLWGCSLRFWETMMCIFHIIFWVYISNTWNKSLISCSPVKYSYPVIVNLTFILLLRSWLLFSLWSSTRSNLFPLMLFSPLRHCLHLMLRGWEVVERAQCHWRVDWKERVEGVGSHGKLCFNKVKLSCDCVLMSQLSSQRCIQMCKNTTLRTRTIRQPCFGGLNQLLTALFLLDLSNYFLNGF